jgi:hypothetical protein
MIVEMIMFLTFVVAVGAVIVKAYEWRQDVLYGPYILPGLLRSELTDSPPCRSKAGARKRSIEPQSKTVAIKGCEKNK